MDGATSQSTAAVGSDSMDVGEILSAIWSRKRWIFVFLTLGLVLSILYVRTATPLYTSEAMVALTDQKNLSGAAGGLSELAGLDDSDPSKQMIDRVMARNFIIQIVDDLNLRKDSYYNAEPVPRTGVIQAVKSLRDRILGPRAVESADDRVARMYRNAVKLSISRGDSIIIRAIHQNPNQAARIANRIATLILESLKDDARRSYLDQQEYLVELMTKAQDDIDRAQRALSGLERTPESEFSRFTLQRDARIAEAVYNTLVEKVQTQIAVMGYEGEVGAIYQTATPSVRPSRPSVVLALGSGLVGGTIMGVMVALVSALSSGALFTRSSISRTVGARNNIYPHNFSARSVSASRALNYLDRIRAPWLAELLWSVGTEKSGIILIIPTAPRISSTQTALLIGRSLARSDNKTAVILLDQKASSTVKHVDTARAAFTSEVVEIQRVGTLHVFAPSRRSSATEVLISSGLTDRICSSAASDFSYIVIGATNDTGPAAAIALSSTNPVSVVITQAGKTTGRRIEQLKTVLDLDINIGV